MFNSGDAKQCDTQTDTQQKLFIVKDITFNKILNFDKATTLIAKSFAAYIDTLISSDKLCIKKNHIKWILNFNTQNYYTKCHTVSFETEVFIFYLK